MIFKITSFFFIGLQIFFSNQILIADPLSVLLIFYFFLCGTVAHTAGVHAFSSDSKLAELTDHY